MVQLENEYLKNGEIIQIWKIYLLKSRLKNWSRFFLMQNKSEIDNEALYTRIKDPYKLQIEHAREYVRKINFSTNF